ncbi:MAG TPA: ABC transporter permease [Candidatus Solibacter sp.]|nr:ABC transporter permease [Candidatus Solibacter sp.]
MFLRLVADSFTRRPRRKVLTAAALSLGMAVVTAALSVSLDVGDRLAREFRSLGANLVITPQADSLPLEIGGVDYRPVNAGAYLPEADLPKIKTIFWHNNIIGFAPVLEFSTALSRDLTSTTVPYPGLVAGYSEVTVIGTWSTHPVRTPDGEEFVTGVEKTNPWWHIEGRWFGDGKKECALGQQLARREGLKIGDKILLRGWEIAPQSNVLLDDERLRMSVRENIAFVVRGILSTGGPEDDAVVIPLDAAQQLADKTGLYRTLYVSALTKPEDDFARRDPSTMNAADLERWSCTPYISSIAASIKEVLPGTDVRVIRRVAEGEGTILTRVQTLLWLVTLAALLAAALAVGASSAASVIERRTEIGLMKALGAGSGTVGFLLAAEQLVLAFVGGGIGYSLGTFLARLVGQKIFGVTPEPSLLVLAAVLALAAIVTLLGSAIPLRRASRYEPAPILRGE